jgi:DNA primase
VTFPPSFPQELLQRTDIVDVIGKYVRLKKSGANFVGLCPFHDEKSPSFSVSPTKQFYHCFGCGKGGDAISFLTEYTGATFQEAVQDLAQRIGVVVPEDDRSPLERERQQRESAQVQDLTSVLERAAGAYRAQLNASARAKAYLNQRAVSAQAIDTYSLGYAPQGWNFLSSVFERYDSPNLSDSGLVVLPQEGGSVAQRRYDRFRDRIMFPIRNLAGQIIGFGGRVLTDEKPKYLNSPETPAFHKGRELYGLYEARTAIRAQDFALVVEGYMDVISLAQYGVGNAVATLGTACTSDHMVKLFRFTANVVFSFDGDEAGRKAARKALDIALPFATDTRSVKFLFLPPEHDPDSFIRAKGPSTFTEAVHKALPLSRFMLDAAAQDCDMSSAEGRARFGSNVRTLWQSLPEGLFREQLLADIAERTKVSLATLQTSWNIRYSANAPNYTAPTSAKQRSTTSWHKGYKGYKKAFEPNFDELTLRAEILPPYERPACNVARLLMRDSAQWEYILTDPDRELLSRLPKPYSDLFGWIDSQFMEFGPQSLPELLSAAQDQPFAKLALQLHESESLGSLPDDDAYLNSAKSEQILPLEIRQWMITLHLQTFDKEIERMSVESANEPDNLELKTAWTTANIKQAALKRTLEAVKKEIELLKHPHSTKNH